MIFNVGSVSCEEKEREVELNTLEEFMAWVIKQNGRVIVYASKDVTSEDVFKNRHSLIIYDDDIE